MQVVRYIPSVTEGEMARVYRFKPLKKAHVIRCYPRGQGLVFSFFAKAVSGSEKLRVTLEAPFSSQSKDLKVTDRWERFEVTLKNEMSLQPLNVFITPQIAARAHSDIAIAFAQCEEGLFATSPIAPDIELPAISNNPSGQGATREADRIWLDKEKTGVVIDSNSATAIFVGTPIPNTDQIMETQFLTCLSFWSSQSGMELSVGISGRHGAKFVVRKREGGEDEFIYSNVIAGHELYFVCAVFDRNIVSVIINGAIAITTTLAQSIVFDRTYLGSSHGKNPNSFCGHIKQYTQFSTPLLYPRILEIYREACPENPQHTYDYMLRYFRYALTTDSEIATVDACLDDEGFSYFVRQLDFAIPEIYEQFPPGKPFREEDVRDWVMALMKRPGVRASRETYTKIGRTDLTLSYLLPSERDRAVMVEQLYRVEFKIWGRNGYNDAPAQPLKYMTEGEMVGAFIMIDRRAAPAIGDFERIVESNAEFPCISVKDFPILNSNLRYFVSFHEDDRYRNPRMMINIFLPIGG